MLVKYGTEDPRFFDEYISNQVVLINFWASYCGPCKKEIPELQKRLSQYKNIRIYYINIDEGSEKSKVDSLVEEFQIAEQTLLDPYQVAAKKYIKPKVLVPANILIDKDGTILFESKEYNETTILDIEKIIKKIK
jgi:thiol-disulfide isomerase/thioredoxin